MSAFPEAWITSPPSWPEISESLMVKLPYVVIKSPAPALLIMVTLSNTASLAKVYTAAPNP